MKKRRAGNKRKYTINHDYFNKWSHDMAYILGFWFTDGYMHESRCEISITQHKKDKYLLEAILMRMGSNSPLRKHGKNSLQFHIFSQKITNAIKKYGGHQNKSYSIRFPKIIPKKYIPDFVRGCWDGDGCIWFVKRSKKKPRSSLNCSCQSSIVSASRFFIYDLLKILRKEIGGFRGRVRHVNNCYVLEAGVNDTIRLREFLYKGLLDGSLFLKRKYKKFIVSGEIRPSSHDIEFISYKKAKEVIAKLKIKNRGDWQKYRAENNIKNIPCDPEKTYKECNGRGWIAFFDKRCLI